MPSSFDPIPLNTNGNSEVAPVDPVTPVISAATPVASTALPALAPDPTPVITQPVAVQPALQQQPNQYTLPLQPQFAPPQGYPQQPYGQPMMPSYMPMNQGYNMAPGYMMPPYPQQPEKQKPGIFSSIILPLFIMIAIIIASYYGYGYIQTTSKTQITKAQITNELPTSEPITTEESPNAEPSQESPVIEEPISDQKILR